MGWGEYPKLPDVMEKQVTDVHKTPCRVRTPLGIWGSERTDQHPVSYTHLRAHETVLDIVCRLLLEKKKR